MPTSGEIDAGYAILYLTAGLQGHLTFTSIFNSFHSLTTFLGNALILIVLHEESSLHPPYKLFLRCFSTTDLCVDITSEPLSVTYWMPSELTLEYLSHCITRRSINRLDFVFCVSVDTDFSNHGQTPRSVVGTETQTSCNFKANPRDCC